MLTTRGGCMPEELQSKITDEHRAYIGRKSEPISFTVTEADAARQRALLQDEDPRWAEGTGIAPPYVLGLWQNVGRGRGMPRVLPNAITTHHDCLYTPPIRIAPTL